MLPRDCSSSYHWAADCFSFWSSWLLSSVFFEMSFWPGLGVTASHFWKAKSEYLFVCFPRKKLTLTKICIPAFSVPAYSSAVRIKFLTSSLEKSYEVRSFSLCLWTVWNLQVIPSPLGLSDEEEQLRCRCSRLFVAVLEVYFCILHYCTSAAKQSRSQFYL